MINLAIIGWVVRTVSKTDLLTAHRSKPESSATSATLEAEKPKPKPSQSFKPLNVSLRRWAILASSDVQKLGISEQLMTSLSARDGIELVDRDSLAAATRELQLSELIGSQSAEERLKLGQILHADLLIFISLERSGEYETLRIAQSDTKYGCRLGLDFIFWEPDKQQQILKQIESEIIDRVERLNGSIQHLIGVAPFLNKSLTQEADRLQKQIPDILQNGLTAHPGVAVLDMEEAKAIGRELTVAGSIAADGVLPLWVEGEYEMLPAVEAEPLSFRLKLTLRNARGKDEVLTYDRVELNKARELLITEVTGKILAASNASALASFDREDQAKQLAQRANALDEIGSHAAAVQLYEAAVLLEPKNVELRLKTIDAIGRWCGSITQPFDRRRLFVTTEKFEELSAQLTIAYFQGLEHAEYLLANKLCDANQAHSICPPYHKSTFGFNDRVPNAPREILQKERREQVRKNRELTMR